MRHKERKPTRLILVRHLDTKARRLRDEIREDSRYCRLKELVDNPLKITQHKEEIQLLGSELMQDYNRLPEDRYLSILPEEIPIGRQLGRKIVATYGMPDRWEVSTFRRTRQSSQAMREGIRSLQPLWMPPAVLNSSLTERNFGEASKYPMTRIYLATHFSELVKHAEDSHHFVYNGGESTHHFRRRIGKQVRFVHWSRKYEGKSSVFVTHNLVIEEHLRRLIGHNDGNDNIWTGSVTVLEAEPKKFLRPRRFHLVGQIGQQLV